MEQIMTKYWHLFHEGFSDYAGYLIRELSTWHSGNYFYALWLVSLVFFLWEWLLPWKKEQALFRKQWGLDLFYMFFNFFLFSLIGFHALSEVFSAAFTDFWYQLTGRRHWVAWHINSWPNWAQLLSLFVLRDFIQWNIHRLLHRVPWLWQFHKVHHSAREMGFATHLRYHWMETVVYRSLEYIPLGMIGFGIEEFFTVHLVALVIGHFNHSNIDVPLGPLRYLLNNPQMHTWHHAKHLPEGRRYGVNYGLSLSIWDYLFGTAYVPDSGREVALGFAGDEDFPQHFWGQVTYGFRQKKRTLNPPSHRPLHGKSGAAPRKQGA